MFSPTRAGESAKARSAEQAESDSLVFHLPGESAKPQICVVLILFEVFRSRCQFTERYANGELALGVCRPPEETDGEGVHFLQVDLGQCGATG